MKQSEIKFTVSLDEEHIPETIGWSATDSGMKGEKPAGAILLAVWDPKEHTSLRIDLWTKKMLVDDMKRFFYENFMTMSDTYRRATNDDDGAAEIKRFAESFITKMTHTLLF
jgi:gliding motility-associated protein GldC